MATLSQFLGIRFTLGMGSSLLYQYANLGLMLGMVFGAIIVLRPLTNRLLRPKYRVILWYVGWAAGYLLHIYSQLGWLTLLPFTFRSALIPKQNSGAWAGRLPGFFTREFWETGRMELQLSGGRTVPLEVERWVLGAAALLWAVTAILLCLWSLRREKRLSAALAEGELLSQERAARYGLTRGDTAVVLCPWLETSFVTRADIRGPAPEARYIICLQAELPPEQLRLVLLHEEEHIRHHHIRYKMLAVAGAFFYWWNPVIWAACRLTSRDLELACDQAVLERLNPEEWRVYALTLLELASGRHMWGSLNTFGECDAALRIKMAASWRPERRRRQLVSCGLTALLVLFFFTESTQYKTAKPAPPADELAAWADYLAGPTVVSDLEQDGWRAVHGVWTNATKSLLVLEDDHRWVYYYYNWNGESYYPQQSTTISFTPSLEGRVRLG